MDIEPNSKSVIEQAKKTLRRLKSPPPIRFLMVYRIVGMVEGIFACRPDWDEKELFDFCDWVAKEYGILITNELL